MKMLLYEEQKLITFNDSGDIFNSDSANIRIIVQLPPPSITGAIGEALSIPMKRKAEPQVYNHKPVKPYEREFWNDLSKAQIILKLPDNANNVNKTIYMSEPLSKYMKVEGNKIVLGDNIMLNSQDELIFCDGNPVIESGTRITIDFVKVLCFCKSPTEIVYGIQT